MADIFDQAEAEMHDGGKPSPTGDVFDQAEAAYNTQLLQQDTTGRVKSQWEMPIEWDPNPFQGDQTAPSDNRLTYDQYQQLPSDQKKDIDNHIIENMKVGLQTALDLSTARAKKQESSQQIDPLGGVDAFSAEGTIPDVNSPGMEEFMRPIFRAPLETLKTVAFLSGGLSGITGNKLERDIQFKLADDVNKAIVKMGLRPNVDASFAEKFVDSAAGLIPYLATGSVGAIAILANSTSSGMDALDQGIDKVTATAIAWKDLLFTAAMFKVPMGASTVPKGMATGAVVNTVLAVAGQAVEKGILTVADYKDLSDAIKLDDPQQLGMALAMGIGYGGLQSKGNRQTFKERWADTFSSPTAQSIAEDIAPVSDVPVANNATKIQGTINMSKRLDLPPEFVWENYDTIMAELEKQGIAPYNPAEVKPSGKEEKAGLQVNDQSVAGQGPSLHEAASGEVKATVNPNDVSLDKLKTTLKTEEGAPGITVEKGYYHDMPEGDPNLIKIVSRNEKGEVNGILDIPIIMGKPDFPTIATNQKGIARELVKKAEAMGYDVTKMDNIYTPDGADFMNKTIKNKTADKEVYPSGTGIKNEDAAMGILSGQEGAIRVPKVINETAEAIAKIKENIGNPRGAGAKDGIEAMQEHHRAIRDIDYVYGPKGPISDIAKMFDAEVPAERQQLVLHAIQQPEKYSIHLTPTERAFVDLYNKESAKVTEYAKDAGALKDNNPNYLYQWWIDKKTGEAYNTHYGKYSETAPQFRQRKYQTYEEGLAAGETPASTNPFTLLQKSASAVNKAVEARILFQTLASIEKYGIGDQALSKMELKDEPTEMLRSSQSTEPKPLRIIESWKQLKEQGLTEDYVRYSHDSLDKPIVFKDTSGNIHILDGDVGITKELYPYVKAYLESPTYGNLSKINFASKSMKLMSGFHILSLSWQGMAGGLGKGRVPLLNVIDGLKKIEGGSETLRILYRNGLELRGYADIGPAKTGLFDAIENNKYTKYLGKVLTAAQKLTFEIVHPGIKANTAFTIFEDLVSKAEGKKGSALSIAEKDKLAKDTVHYTDRLFSGEDYKTALLQTNKWMAEYFYAPEARKKWQLTLISPQWQKAHIGMVIDVAKSFATKEGRAAPTAELYRKYLYSALTIYGVANLYNWTMTQYMDNDGKFMVGNDGHNSFSVRAPYNDPDGKKVYFRPLKSIFEVPEYLCDVIGKSISKMAPWVSTAAEQVKPMPYDKYKGYANIPKRVGNVATGLFMPMAEPTIMSDSKATPSKVLSVIGVPTSKGYDKGIQTRADQEAYEANLANKRENNKLKSEIRKERKKWRNPE